MPPFFLADVLMFVISFVYMFVCKNGRKGCGIRNGMRASELIRVAIFNQHLHNKYTAVGSYTFNLREILFLY